MERFLIINPFGIGDCLFTTPVVKALKENYPDCYIGYWCNERVGPLLKGQPGIDRVFPLSRGDIKRVYRGVKGPISWLKGIMALLRLIRDIRREEFDTAFDFSLDSRYGLWSKLAGIKKRIGFDYKGRGRFLTDKTVLDGYSNKHVVEYYAGLLKFIGIEPKNIKLSLSADAQGGVSDKTIGIAMGGGESWGRDAIYKQWPAEKFGRLAQRIVRDTGVRIVLLGSANEKSLAEIVKGKMGQLDKGLEGDDKGTNGHVSDLTGKLNLEELASTIKGLKLLICNDGGPMHMAVALGVKTVSIFGPVDEKVYGPYPADKDHIVVKKDVPCRPCYKGFRFPGCNNNKICLEDITVEEVYEQVERLLRPPL